MLMTLIIAVFVIIALILAVLLIRKKRKQSLLVTDEDIVDNKQVYIGNLSYQVDEDDLRDYFGKFGAIEQVRVVRNHHSGRSKGFGFVTYKSINEAKNSLAAHGKKYKDRTIVVRIAKPR